jgi:hypothetical protein
MLTYEYSLLVPYTQVYNKYHSMGSKCHSVGMHVQILLCSCMAYKGRRAVLVFIRQLSCGYMEHMSCALYLLPVESI